VPEWVLDEASDRAIHLYVRLTRYANRDGQGWPSRATLAEKMRCSVDTIDRAVKELERVGALQVERRTDPDNPKRHLSSLYTLLVDKGGSRIGETGGSRSGAARVAAAVRPKEKPEKKATTSSRRSPETPVPQPFVVTPEMRAWVREQGMEVNVAHETAQFTDHALAHDRRARNWEAAWRTWMRKAEQFRLRKGTSATTEGREWV
jgi:DNA-binding transcriptional MocR family regulator